MFDRIRQRLVDFRNRFSSNIVFFNEPERGIGFNFIFGGEYDTKAWENAFSELKQPNREAIMIIVEKAVDRSVEERATFVQTLTSTNRGILIAKSAKQEYQKRLSLEQFEININSLSQTNLSNMHQALRNLHQTNY